jgi:hypothetical protein
MELMLFVCLGAGQTLWNPNRLRRFVAMKMPAEQIERIKGLGYTEPELASSMS